MSYIRVGIYYLMEGYLFLIFVSIIMSWFPGIYQLKFFRAIKITADAYMKPFHGLLVLGGFLDFTPMVGMILFELLIRAYVFLAF